MKRPLSSGEVAAGAETATGRSKIEKRLGEPSNAATGRMKKVADTAPSRVADTAPERVADTAAVKMNIGSS